VLSCWLEAVDGTFAIRSLLWISIAAAGRNSRRAMCVRCWDVLHWNRGTGFEGAVTGDSGRMLEVGGELERRTTAAFAR